MGKDADLLLVVAVRAVFLLAPENTGNLQASAEGLIEKHPCLELGNEREPGQEGDRSEQEKAHYDFVAPS